MMEVLTQTKVVIKGDYTYSLMEATSGYVLIDNHKTKSKSVIVPVSALKELLGYKDK